MKNPMAVLEKVRGFMQSRVILTGAELDLFTQIHRGVNTASAIVKTSRLGNSRVYRYLADPAGKTLWMAS